MVQSVRHSQEKLIVGSESRMHSSPIKHQPFKVVISRFLLNEAASIFISVELRYFIASAKNTLSALEISSEAAAFLNNFIRVGGLILFFSTIEPSERKAMLL